MYKKVSIFTNLAIFTLELAWKWSNFQICPLSAIQSCDGFAEASAHSAGTDLQPHQTSPIHTLLTVPYANADLVKPFKEHRWTRDPTRTCTRYSGSRWHGRQRSHSCLLPASHRLYEWSFEKQPQFELHLRNTANGTEFRVKHGSEQCVPPSASADGLQPLKSPSWQGCMLEAELIL